MANPTQGMKPSKSATGARFVKARGGAAVKATSAAGGHNVGGKHCASKRAAFKTGSGKGY